MTEAVSLISELSPVISLFAPFIQQALVKAIAVNVYPEQSVFAREGDPLDGFGIILSGGSGTSLRAGDIIGDIFSHHGSPKHTETLMFDIDTRIAHLPEEVCMRTLKRAAIEIASVNTTAIRRLPDSLRCVVMPIQV